MNSIRNLKDIFEELYDKALYTFNLSNSSEIPSQPEEQEKCFDELLENMESGHFSEEIESFIEDWLGDRYESYDISLEEKIAQTEELLEGYKAELSTLKNKSEDYSEDDSLWDSLPLHIPLENSSLGDDNIW